MNARMVISAGLAAGVLAIAAGPANASIVGEWTFDSDQGATVLDSSGNGNDGLLFGAVSRAPGLAGSGLSFTGAPGGVAVPDSQSLEPASAVSVAAWVQSGTSPGAFRYIVGKGWNGCIASSYGLYTGPSGGLQFYVGLDHGRSYVRTPSISPDVWDGAWHLAVGTFDGADLRLYVDGVEIGTGSTLAAPLSYSLPGSNDLFIGDYPGCQDRAFAGEIDDVRVWNTALGAAQIAALMPQPPAVQDPGAPPAAGVAPTPPIIAANQPLIAANGLPIASRARAVQLLAPRISRLSVSLGRHRRIRTSRPLAARMVVTVGYFDTEPARSMLVLQRATAGVRRRGRCVRPRSLRSAQGRLHLAPCTRWTTVARARHVDAIGRNTIRKIALIAPRSTAHRYRLIVRPRLGKLRGPSVRLRFHVGG